MGQCSSRAEASLRLILTAVGIQNNGSGGGGENIAFFLAAINPGDSSTPTVYYAYDLGPASLEGVYVPEAIPGVRALFENMRDDGTYSPADAELILSLIPLPKLYTEEAFASERMFKLPLFDIVNRLSNAQEPQPLTPNVTPAHEVCIGNNGNNCRPVPGFANSNNACFECQCSSPSCPECNACDFSDAFANN